MYSSLKLLGLVATIVAVLAFTSLILLDDPSSGSMGSGVMEHGA